MDSDNNSKNSPHSAGNWNASRDNSGNQRRNNYSKYHKRKKTNPRPSDSAIASDISNAVNNSNKANTARNTNTPNVANTANTTNSRNVSQNVRDNSQKGKTTSNSPNRRDNNVQSRGPQQGRQQSGNSAVTFSNERSRSRWDPEKIKIEETYEDIKKENERIEKEIWLEIAEIHNTRLD